MKEIEKMHGQVCLCKATLLIIKAAVKSGLSREALIEYVEQQVDDVVNDVSYRKWVEANEILEAENHGE